MDKNKLNCWEFEKCGREPGGVNADELGVCPAGVEKKLDGAHGGKNAGRACWVVAGTFCDGEIQGTYASKETSCIHCDFFKNVVHEALDQGDYNFSHTLLEKLK